MVRQWNQNLIPKYLTKNSGASRAGGSDVTAESPLGRSTFLWWLLAFSTFVLKKERKLWAEASWLKINFHTGRQYRDHRRIIVNVTGDFDLGYQFPSHFNDNRPGLLCAFQEEQCPCVSEYAHYLDYPVLLTRNSSLSAVDSLQCSFNSEQWIIILMF